MALAEVEPSPQRENNQTATIQLFDFNGAEVRLVQIKGNPWFVAPDLNEALGWSYSNLRYHCEANLGADEEKVVTGRHPSCHN